MICTEIYVRQVFLSHLLKKTFLKIRRLYLISLSFLIVFRIFIHLWKYITLKRLALNKKKPYLISLVSLSFF